MVSADVSVRTAWSQDAGDIAGLQVTAWARRVGDLESVPPVDLVVQSWQRVLTAPPDARLRGLVALERAAVRGFALVHPALDPDTDPVSAAEVAEFVIDPDHLGQGHGSRLLQAVADTLVADGFLRALWWIDADDDALRSYAQTAGWSPDGAHRELADEQQTRRVKQVRLHTALA